MQSPAHHQHRPRLAGIAAGQGGGCKGAAFDHSQQANADTKHPIRQQPEIARPRARDDPVALFAIGVSLYRPGVPVLRADVMMITGAKLLLQPYLVAIAAIYLLGLSGFEMHVLVLMAALPVAGSAFLFAERAGSDPDAISGAILVSTALAFLSFSALCWAMGLEMR